MTFEDYLAVLRRRWWLLVLGLLAGLATGFAVWRVLPPRFEAVATLLVVQRQDPGVLQLNDLEASERLATTFSRLVLLAPVLEVAAATLGEDDLEALERRLSVSNPRGTQLLEVTAVARDPTRARDLANTVAATFIRSNQSELSSRPGAVSIVEAARAPSTPAWPRLWPTLALAALGGLLIATGGAALLEYRDDAVRTAYDLALVTGEPPLAQVERLRRPGAGPAAVHVALAPSSSAAESYRALRTALSYVVRPLAAAHAVVLVSSARGSEGKSTVVANLAVAFGLAGRRVLVLDADLRQPAQRDLFAGAREAGLTDLLGAREEIEVAAAVQPTAHPHVDLLAAGRVVANPAELLGSARMARALETLRSRYELVLVDTPPVLATTDAAVLSELADASVLVAASGGVRPVELASAVAMLTRGGTPLAGTVLNRVRAADLRSAGYASDGAYAAEGARAARD